MVTYFAMAVNASSTLRPFLALVSMKGTPYSCGMRHSRVRMAPMVFPQALGVIFEDKETRGVSRNLKEKEQMRKGRA